MAKIVSIFGRLYVLRTLQAERFKKQWTIARPPPWFRNPDALSKGQVAQILKFSRVAHETAGRKLKERMDIIGARASGSTGFRVEKPRISLPRLGRIVTIAERYGIPIPPEIRTALPTIKE